MKYLCYFLLMTFNLNPLEAQQKSSGSEILSAEQVKAIFTDSLKKDFKIAFPIFRVYKFTDKSGDFLCVLTESKDSIGSDEDTINRSVRSIALRMEKDKFVKVWEINDNIVKSGADEYTIWFWTGYFDFKDFDNDGLIEPIIVYGTKGMNGFGDGRIKIIVVYKGQKIVIRQQNGVLDDERQTRIDQTFYSLPKDLRENIRSKMALMTSRDEAIFTVNP